MSQCTYCSKSYPSRNVLFRHLRDPTNSCGEQVVNQGGIPLGPSKSISKKDKRQALLNQAKAVVSTAHVNVATNDQANATATGNDQAKATQKPPKKSRQRKRNREATVFATTHTQELWFGGIPTKYANKKDLSVILWNNVASGEPSPAMVKAHSVGHNSK